MLHSRSTVATDFPTSTAMSAMVIPPKNLSSTMRPLIINRRHADERPVQRQDIHILAMAGKGSRALGLRLVQRQFQGRTPLGCAMGLRVVDESPTHHLRGQAEELDPILGVDLALICEPEIDLIDQSCGLQGMVRPLPAQER